MRLRAVGPLVKAGIMGKHRAVHCLEQEHQEGGWWHKAIMGQGLDFTLCFTWLSLGRKTILSNLRHTTKTNQRWCWYRPRWQTCSDVGIPERDADRTYRSCYVGLFRL